MSIATVLNEDSLEALIKMDTGIADLILLDAPYFDYKTGHRQDKEGKLSQSLVQQDREDQIKTVWECIRVLKEGRSFWYFTNWQEAWWFQEKFHSFLRNEVIWDKGNWAAGHLEGSLANRYEVIFLGTKGSGWTYRGGKRIDDIWKIDRVGTDRIHSTQKPVALYEKIIELSTDRGAFIIDPYLGSGSSIIAALRTGRDILGYELDKDYYERILERVGSFRKEGKDVFD